MIGRVGGRGEEGGVGGENWNRESWDSPEVVWMRGGVGAGRPAGRGAMGCSMVFGCCCRGYGCR